MRILPTNQYESRLWLSGLHYIAGVDEVGRGCFAGPVVAAAVILPKDFQNTYGIDDSKRLTPKKREELAIFIKEVALDYSIAEISVPVINAMGIGKATQQAFAKAITSLKKNPDHILMDAFLIQSITPTIQTPIIHGDRISVSIAAASIIAKVYRDKLMETLHEVYKMYDFVTNKGYGTKAHREAIVKHGLSDLHRTSFNLTKYSTLRVQTMPAGRQS